jgi:hypothetical protein
MMSVIQAIVISMPAMAAVMLDAANSSAFLSFRKITYREKSSNSIIVKAYPVKSSQHVCVRKFNIVVIQGIAKGKDSVSVQVFSVAAYDMT